jgi:hypothetical protein
MALRKIEPPIEMSSRTLLGGGGVEGGWLACEADNFTAICELIV